MGIRIRLSLFQRSVSSCIPELHTCSVLFCVACTHWNTNDQTHDQRTGEFNTANTKALWRTRPWISVNGPPYDITKIPLILWSNILIDQMRSLYCGRLEFMLESVHDNRYINSISGASTCRQNILISLNWNREWRRLSALTYSYYIMVLFIPISNCVT